ncbi:hypothetical protein NQ317_003231, partial [Molorchus minor]
SSYKGNFRFVAHKIQKQYELAYKRFVEWCDRNNVAGKYSENVMLAYFEQNFKIWKSSTLWAHFSMIKAMLNVENNQDISACRREELCQMSLNNIEDLRNTLVVNISDSKTRVLRTSTVITETYIDLYRELALRPAHVNHQSRFIKYTSNKCTIQPVGIHIFEKMPTDIARFLKLPNSEFYTGHCFRRTSASLLADSGANLCTIKLQKDTWKILAWNTPPPQKRKKAVVPLISSCLLTLNPVITLREETQNSQSLYTEQNNYSVTVVLKVITTYLKHILSVSHSIECRHIDRFSDKLNDYAIYLIQRPKGDHLSWVLVPCSVLGNVQNLGLAHSTGCMQMQKMRSILQRLYKFSPATFLERIIVGTRLSSGLVAIREREYLLIITSPEELELEPLMWQWHEHWILEIFAK